MVLSLPLYSFGTTMPWEQNINIQINKHSGLVFLLLICLWNLFEVFFFSFRSSMFVSFPVFVWFVYSCIYKVSNAAEKFQFSGVKWSRGMDGISHGAIQMPMYWRGAAGCEVTLVQTWKSFRPNDRFTCVLHVCVDWRTFQSRLHGAFNWGNTLFPTNLKNYISISCA